ncbi:acyltransferase family protein [Paracoccus sp. MBLB3053]|uniref:Acyltransferase family protein n=1 Tax=Paracoccus aurantius TaxID=3073814 RepID=A0ABU2HPG1_9RHOB|nr:acyltransferase family protein [Paracoccus sp. MBLB3053]MDS9466425.1 acyltransferase family protein [Paracoccus sp. MBLB3053]
MRNGSIDYFRLVAAFGIVWFHSQAPFHRLAYLGLPFFLILLGMPSGEGLRHRLRRLLVPFVIWSAVYGAVNTAQALSRGAPPFDWLQANMLLTGTALHLWFLPFACLVALLGTLLRAQAPLLLAPILAALLVACFATPTMPPFGQWAFGIVPALIGLAYFRLGSRALLSLTLSGAVLFALRDDPDNATIVWGSALAIFVTSIHLPSTWLSELCARLSLTVYLAHILVQVIGGKLGLSGYALAGFGIVGSLLLALALEAANRRGGQGILRRVRPKIGAGKA